MTKQQQLAIECAYADLVGVYQYSIRDGKGGADNGHDWRSHKETIFELENAFPYLITPAPLDDEEDDEEGDDLESLEEWRNGSQDND